MNRVFRRLFFINLAVIGISFLWLGSLLNISFPEYLGFLFMGCALALVLTFVIGKLFLNPIQEMRQVTAKIAQGDFNSRLSLSRNDELGGLAKNVNQMSNELQNMIAEITNDKNELTAILSSMVEGVVVIGGDERIVLLTAPVMSMLELRTQNTVGRPYWEVIRNEEINALLKEAIVHKRSLRREIMIIAPEESHFSVQVSCVLLDSGKLSGVVAVFHEITDLKKLERLRSEFVANVSHELKTPLTSIKGFAETLKDGALNDKEKARKFLEIIHKHAERLEHLVNDLLNLSAIESKEVKLNLEKISVGSLIESTVGLCRDQMESHRHRCEVRVEKSLPLVSVDKGRMEQVFLNLLDNAVKFTSPGGLISIEARREDGFVRIDFADTGIGIDPKHLPRLFERFYRVDQARSRDLGGTGLGLSIVKHIILLHDGKISVTSELEKGSVFSVFLPHSPV